MIRLQKLVAFVIAAFLFAMPAKAASDPLTTFLNGIFGSGPVSAQPVRDFHHRGYHHGRVAYQETTGGHSVLASYYGHGERLNRHTASGQVFSPNGLTAAHRSLPLGTRLLVSHGGHSVVVTVNDRGPAAYTGRSIDLSYGAARAIGMVGAGVAPVRIARLN